MKYFLLFTFTLISLTLKAQYRPQHSLYMQNNYLLNPAITGIENYTDIQTGYRQQWTGIEGMPKTFYLSFHTPLGLLPSSEAAVHSIPESPDTGYSKYKKPKTTYHGVGVILVSDEVGPFSRHEANLSYAIHKSIAENVVLSAGFSGGVMRQNLDLNKVITTNAQDPLLLDNQFVEWQPVLTAGFFAHGNKWYAGLSGLQYLNNDNQKRTHTSFGHVYATFAYQYEIAFSTIAQPIVMLRWDNTTAISYDIGMRFIFSENFMIGGAYRSTEEIVLLSGFHINSSLSVSYAYDVGMSSLSGNLNGTHELALSLRVWKKINAIPCPPFL